MSTRLDPARHPWMNAAPTRAVMSALLAEGGAARFVGGAVRNALLHEPVAEVDIATPLPPDEVMRRLKQAGLGAVPTGLAHGTVTAIASGKPFEITTLRRDVQTDGRHAVVAYTDDWAEDAARRDFTMNAIYADVDGTLADPTGGIADIEARRVRFVGDPVTRIREDYLRILRLFRFHAWYGEGPLDAAALKAAIAERAGLKRLSAERIQKELLRLLEAPGAAAALRAMEESGILAEILPAPVALARAEKLASLLRAHHLPSAPLLLLAALLPSLKAAEETAAALKLSNADRDRLIAAADPQVRIDAALSPSLARRAIYRAGLRRFRDRLLFCWAESSEDAKDKRWTAVLSLSYAWEPPAFPLTGRDVLEAGVDEGPGVGRTLAALEQWWVEQDFLPGRDALLVRLKELVAKPNA